MTRKKKQTKFAEGNRIFEIIYEICFFFLITGYFLFYDSRGLQLTFVCIGLAGAATIFLIKSYSSSLKLPLNTIWYFLFFTLAEISALWAHSPESATSNYLRLMIVLLALGLGLTQYADTTQQVERLFTLFTASVLLIAAVQVIFTPSGRLFSNFLGSAVGGNNPNTFGYIVAIAAVSSFYFGYIKERKPYYIAVVFLLFCSILSSSRKSLMLIPCGIIMIILLARNKKRHFLHLFLIALVAVAALPLLLKDENLYNVIGYRFDKMFDFLSSGSAENDQSLWTRDYYIEFAGILFEEKPILGQGFANYSVLLSTESNVSAETYAHNNYWEILADLGVVGFITYYWFYLVVLIKLTIRYFKEKENNLTVLALTLLVAQFVLEWGVVSMTSFFPQTVITLIYLCSYAQNSKRKFRYAPGSAR